MDHYLKPDRLDIDTALGLNAEKQWIFWKKTFENFLEESVASDEKISEASKFKLLINHISHKTYSLIESCTTYESAMAVLDGVFIKPKNLIYARHRLNTRTQEKGESIDLYIQELRLLAKNCEFKAVSAMQNEEDNIRDAFISGLSSSEIQQKLLENIDLSLDDAIMKAQTLESAQVEANSYKSPDMTALIYREELLEVISQGSDKIDDKDTICGKGKIKSNPKHANKDGYFSCPICKKELKTEESLVKHKISMHQKRKHVGKITGFGVNRLYHCKKCPYNTPHSQTLVNHVRKHNGDRPFHCECGKSFSQSSSLSAHRKTHSNTTYFTCSICGKQFKHAFSLKKHLDVHENGKYECDICHKQLKSRQTLQDHMCRHYNIRNYNCEDCGSTFVTHSELLNHKRRHSLTKRVECHLCGYKTHTKKSLILHLKRHAGDKSYKCDLCHLSFFMSSDLQRHKRVHTREKPFPCPTCTQRFTHSPSLNKHLKTVHGINWKWSDIKMKILNKEKILQGRIK